MHFTTMLSSILSSILLLNQFYTIECQKSSSTVNTSVGLIRGVRGDYFTSFLGIPYGLVDENNPFGDAKPYPRFTTVYNASQNPEICPQMANGIARGSLDCLRLNLYTPNENCSSLLPVIVYIHGGSFVVGNGNLNTFSPKFLVRNDVIVVTINYRLGAYGFLCWEKSDYNNQGMKDQKIALNWIKDNVASFGGDANNIVLTGLSSGSLTVDYHLLYDNDYLNKVVLHSGHLVSPLGFADHNLGLKIVESLGIDVKNKSVDDYIDFLTNIKVYDLIELTYNETYSYCNDGTLFKNNSLARLKDINILVGNTNKEAGLWYGKEDADYFKKFNFTSELSMGFHEVTDQMVEDVKCFYNKSDIKDDVIDFISDFRFGYPVERSIKLYLRNNATVYRYRFDYDGGRNFQKVSKNITIKGAIHADDMGYEFDMDIFGNNTTTEDQTMISIFTTLWTNFAKYGKLKHGSKTYPKTNMNTKPYIVLNGTRTHKANHPFKKRMQFWNQFYKDYRNASKTLELFEEF